MPKVSVDSWSPDHHILLDTSVWIAASSGQRQLLHPGVPSIVEQAAHGQRLWVSPLSTLEVVNAIAAGHLRIADFDDWIGDQQRVPGVRMHPITADIAAGSATLPAPQAAQLVGNAVNGRKKGPRLGRQIADGAIWDHNDLIDRIIVATAWKVGITLLTLDPNIISYGESGPVNVLDARAV